MTQVIASVTSRSVDGDVASTLLIPINQSIIYFTRAFSVQGLPERLMYLTRDQTPHFKGAGLLPVEKRTSRQHQNTLP